MKTGSCLCGAVKYEVHGALRPVIVCHCTQCRKQTGSVMHATACASADFELTETRGLRWYRASGIAQRGFCAECGSPLFWKPDAGTYISITAGSIDGALDVPLEGHIYCANAGDYYEICGPGYRKQQWED